jgi:predicted Ser/Thr protein kinase
MGEVYRATDSVLGRTVAVKLLSARYAGEPEARARFRREALAAARVSSSKNVVTLFDVAEHEGRPLIVMEYVDGGSVHDAMRERPVSRDQALAWLEQTAGALDRAHAEGVVHRDVKPANILLDRDGNAHVSDFGIASATGDDTVTLPGTVLGTVGYLSPEQARGEPATPASDRYALGVVAFELLTGRRPFASETATTEALAHLHAPVPKASSYSSGLSPDVDRIFARALAKDPAERPTTGLELVAGLRRALESAEPAVAVRAAPVVEHPAPTRRLVVTRGGSPRRAPVLLAALLVLAAGSVAAFLLSSEDGEVGPSARAAAGATTASTTGSTTRRVTASTGASLNAAGYAKMRDGDYAGALPLLRRAASTLRGTGSLAEAYSAYNLAFTRFALGRCDGILGLLDRSAAIQGHRTEIDELRARWSDRCGATPTGEGDAGDDTGQGKGKGKGKGRKNGHG